jgi:hypothetical protein
MPDSDQLATPTAATMLALHTLAVRHQRLNQEIAMLTKELDRLTTAGAACPLGVGPDSAAAPAEALLRWPRQRLSSDTAGMRATLALLPSRSLLSPASASRPT